MSDLDKELNFNDISGEKTISKSPQKISGRSKKDTGTVISIPFSKNPLTWIDKDIAHCTGEEFVAWAKEVYPVDLSPYVDNLNSLAARVREFKLIMNYHVNSPFQMGKDNKKEKSVH